LRQTRKNKKIKSFRTDAGSLDDGSQLVSRDGDLVILEDEGGVRAGELGRRSHFKECFGLTSVEEK
jgi:hypothetical protein